LACGDGDLKSNGWIMDPKNHTAGTARFLAADTRAHDDKQNQRKQKQNETN
jgi:hypothetical protein